MAKKTAKPQIVPAPSPSPVDRDALKLALNEMFEAGDWEIPDAAVEGKFLRRIEQLEAQNKSLLDLVKQLAGELRGVPVKSGERIDAIAAAQKGGK